MLFNSLEFIFVFLPITLILYHILAKIGFHKSAMIFLMGASLYYYSYWNIKYLFLILISICFNFIIGTLISKFHKKNIMFFGVTVNLLILGYYKYTGFLIENINGIMDTTFYIPNITLPLAISFFTFTQIAYLVDIYTEENYFKNKNYDFITYSLFIVVFPQLIAGPILYHKDLIPQFSSRNFFVFSIENISIGLTFFIVGLSKKVLIADNLSSGVAFVFENASLATFFEAWLGAFAYTFQLYFDFSGYSEMAIGLCLMFNMKLPINFNSPYQATSIIDFWRRWHITLSAFLKKYLYIPLGGNKHGQWRRMRNLIITMLLGGLWHGAGWTFIVWGGLHGIYLIVNHFWRIHKGKMVFPKIISWVLTFLSVVIAWVFFRANNISNALSLLSSMFNVSKLSLPTYFGKYSFLKQLDMFEFNGFPVLSMLTDKSMFIFIIIFSFILVLKFKNIQSYLGYDPESKVTTTKRIANYPRCFILLLGCLFFLAIKQLLTAKPSEFLYFNF